MIEVEGGSRAAAPKGLMTCAFTHVGNFLLLFPDFGIWVFGLRFGWQGWILAFKAEFGPLRLEFGPQGWDLGPEDGIWALTLRSGPRDWDSGLEIRIESGGGETKKEESKNPASV